MKIKTPQSISNVSDFSELQRYSAQTFETIISEINGRLIFGDNIRGQFLSVFFPGSGSEVAMNHLLSRVPIGFLTAGADAPLIVYNGVNANTSQTVFLRASSAGNATVFLF